MKKLTFIKSFFSPFKRPKLKWYIGRVKIGTPYFLPRRWAKISKEKAHEITLEKIKGFEERSKKHPEYNYIPRYEDMYKDVINSHHAVPKKIGFDFLGLGYKTKWSNTDYRFEWSPLISFVFFGLQIAVMVIPEHQNHYWEAWLFYENNTDKTKSPKERIKQCKEEFSMKYTTSSKEEGRKEIDYYDLILK